MARLHEFQGKAILKQLKIAVPQGGAAKTPEEAHALAKEIGRPVMVKAQAWVTGRAGLGGIKKAATPDEAAQAARSMLGLKVKGFVVEQVLVEEQLDIKREFYAEICQLERWSVRLLRGRIDSMLFERTAISRKPDKTIENDLRLLREQHELTPDLVFRDPYLLDFLGLKDTYAEKDLEAAILREMEAFILELGVGFAFLERQKRITVDGVDHYLDLLFFHRHLRRLVAIDLKLDEFKPGDKGQMELYLRWLDKYERKAGEDAPIGLILCAGKKHETVELLDLEKSGIKVSTYWTEVLPKAELERKLHEAVRLARARLRTSHTGLERPLASPKSPARRRRRKE